MDALFQSRLIPAMRSLSYWFASMQKCMLHCYLLQFEKLYYDIDVMILHTVPPLTLYCKGMWHSWSVMYSYLCHNECVSKIAISTMLKNTKATEIGWHCSSNIVMWRLAFRKVRGDQSFDCGFPSQWVNNAECIPMSWRHDTLGA